jgi:hypothetical protein
MKGRIGLVALAACAPLVLFAAPAGAVTPNICEALQHMYCLTASTTVGSCGILPIGQWC